MTTLRLEEIKNIGVVGVGTMGHGIALTYALAGYNITMMDITETILNNAVRQIGNDLQGFVANGLVSEDAVEKTLLRIKTTKKIEEVAEEADFITEAVFEDAELKRRIFTELDGRCPERTIIASNTSFLNVFEIF